LILRFRIQAPFPVSLPIGKPVLPCLLHLAGGFGAYADNYSKSRASRADFMAAINVNENQRH
jgi:hypothetical protein